MFDISELSKPFPPEAISWRVGSTTKDKSKGLALAYIDSRDVMDLLDRVIGPANWQCAYPHADKKTICEISIFINGQWVSKADGAGDSDVEAEKGAISDAFKRAAVKWGIGRYLYDVKNVWVELEAKGNSYIIKQSEYTKLHNILKSMNSSEKLTEDRLKAIIDYINKSTKEDEVKMLHASAKAECEAINDTESYGKITTVAKTKLKQLKEAQNVIGK